MGFQAPVTSCPAPIRKTADEYKDIVGAHYPSFTASLCGATFGVGNFCDIARYYSFSPSVSSLSRLYADEEIYKKLNRRHRRKIKGYLERAKKDPKRYMWAIDDTLITHWGKEIWGADFWYDHTSNSVLFGHKLLVLGLVDRKRNILIPVYWQMLHREVEGSNDHQKGWEIAVELLKIAKEENFPSLTVCTDSWFAGEGFFEALTNHKLSCDYVCEIKSNRLIVKHGKEHLDISVDEFFKDTVRKKIYFKDRKKWACEAVLWFKSAEKQRKTIAVANKKSLEKSPFAYYVCNRLTWSASMIWAISRCRWTIEVQFRELKQSFTLGESAVRSEQAVETSISIAMIALTAIRFEQLARVDANKNQHARPIPAGTIVREYQLQSLVRSISELASPRDSEGKKKLRARLNPRNISRKPTEKDDSSEVFDQRVTMRKAA